MQAEDPARHAFLEKSLGALSQEMQNPTDGNSLEQMLVEQMKVVQQSPLFAQAEEQMSEMMQGLESIKDSDPELYEQQREQLAAATELFRDPAAAMKNLMADLPDIPEEVDDQAEPEMPVLPEGMLRFACGQKKVTPAQRKLFDQLQKDQHLLLPQIERALRQLHAQMNEGQDNDPREVVLFPPDVDQSDVPLSAFSIERVELDRDGRYAILWLDTLFPDFDEHGCGIRIENDTTSPGRDRPAARQAFRDRASSRSCPTIGTKTTAQARGGTMARLCHRWASSRVWAQAPRVRTGRCSGLGERAAMASGRAQRTATASRLGYAPI
jgi:hypothetical protein